MIKIDPKVKSYLSCSACDSPAWAKTSISYGSDPFSPSMSFQLCKDCYGDLELQIGAALDEDSIDD